MALPSACPPPATCSAANALEELPPARIPPPKTAGIGSPSPRKADFCHRAGAASVSSRNASSSLKCRWNRCILRSAIRSNSRNRMSACTKCRAQTRCWPRQPKRGVAMAQHHLHAAERRNVGQGHLAIARDRAHQHPAGPPPGSGSSAKNTRLRPSAAHRCRWCNATRARQGWYRRSAASGSNWIRQGCQAATRPRNHRCRIGTGRG